MILFIAIIVAFLVTFILLPIIIKVSKSIDLLDIPDRRKVHHVSTPSLGGIAIFAGFALSAAISLSFAELAELKYFIAGVFIIFILGVRDDMSSLQAKQKVSVQVVCAFLVVYFSSFKLQGLYGIFGLHELPYVITGSLSIFIIMALTNSYNLIDGIDGLAGVIGIIILSTFGLIFLELNETSLAIMCFAICGSLVAFLFFNWFPSKIFMGDTGSMMLGFIISVLSIVIINRANGLEIFGMLKINASVGLVVGVLILPIYDTSRVFIIRILNGKSPLAPDRNHIHHALLKLGMNHSKAAFSLALLNILVLAVAITFNDTFSNSTLIFLEILIAALFGTAVDFLGKGKLYLGRSAEVESNRSLYVSKSA
jgi:UDP-GlcNAc:undecaprenyl-phosphate/decaprenyl-phosphate GlcNAc-1-phosphate transferase